MGFEDLETSEVQENIEEKLSDTFEVPEEITEIKDKLFGDDISKEDFTQKIDEFQDGLEPEDTSAPPEDIYEELFDDDYLGEESEGNEALEDIADCVEDDIQEASDNLEDTEQTEMLGLTDEQKDHIFKETGWSYEIINRIENMEQYEIYKNAGLHEVEINERKCLVKDIEMDYVDPKTGMTNRELMKKGRTPIDAKTGEPIELHHMGQDFDSPFAELCSNSEHGDGKDSILHDKKVESWRQDSKMKNQYNNVERPNHWKARAKEA